MERAEGAIAVVLQAHLDALAAELRGGRRPDRLRDIVDELMRVEAVVAPDAESAAGCLAGLAVEARLVEPLRPLARDLFRRHRERIDRIRAGELNRPGYVARRAAERAR